MHCRAGRAKGRAQPLHSTSLALLNGFNWSPGGVFVKDRAAERPEDKTRFYGANARSL